MSTDVATASAGSAQTAPPVDFSTFLLSLASTAFIHLGKAPQPESGRFETNLVLARQGIEMLTMLREKTRGNLAEEENKLLEALLYDLRMHYVQAQQEAAITAKA